MSELISIERALLVRLFEVAANRAPTLEELCALALQNVSTLTGVPRFLVSAFEALIAQKSIRVPITYEDVAYSWIPEPLAEIIPGAELTWEESFAATAPSKLEMRRAGFSVGLNTALTIDHVEPCGWQVVARARARLTTLRTIHGYSVGAVELTISTVLESLFSACESKRVAGCCASVAFHIAVEPMREWIAREGGTAASDAERNLDAILAELATERAPQTARARRRRHQSQDRRS